VYRKLTRVDDLYTARAANRQLAPAGCGGITHRKLASVDDQCLYTARAAIQQPALAGFGGMTQRKLAGVDDQCLYTAWAAKQQPALAGFEGMTQRKLAGVDDQCLYTAWAAKQQPALAGDDTKEARWRGRPLHGTRRQPPSGIYGSITPLCYHDGRTQQE
jgi:hypothetical protein